MLRLTFVLPERSVNLMHLRLSHQMLVSLLRGEDFRSPNELPSVLSVGHRDLSPGLIKLKILLVGLHKQRELKNLKEGSFCLASLIESLVLQAKENNSGYC